MCRLGQSNENHQWLMQLIGDWVMEGEASMGPDQEPMKSSGTEKVRAIGELWILGEGEGEMPGGGPAQMLLTLGYDNTKGKFVGSWVGSMMSGMWVYEGELDADRKVLTLSTEGPSMSGDGSTAPYRDVITMINSNTRLLESMTQDSEGNWNKFMYAKYTRRS
ncbi:DUF1579 domain-containing protein [bacterium]|nr:DUF1579 domain-containing protein [bacterium]